MDVDLRIEYIERTLRVPELNKYQQVPSEYKEATKGLSGDQWSLGLAKGVSMEQFWNWAKVDAIDGSGDPISGSERCTYFGKELWFDLGNIMQRKHMLTL